ncbi:glucooligosaccharide oxidase [Nannizzia gypsea CBS 118893]|uniref:Glucooligosaccharide oxidase n=1 Tax=Arthroderma gypseum (strain ATCC MYA-4604 / CBS 118893) TaxID=535722 RepID=E4V2I4_ARTGP|nr:glucooligosaccharide oxidase [Nannizzia gypsea CBS 118893]EFR04249.1 glucooligosaccharide oxidase [Nannizzia gypsea CBS 118893]
MPLKSNQRTPLLAVHSRPRRNHSTRCNSLWRPIGFILWVVLAAGVIIFLAKRDTRSLSLCLSDAGVSHVVDGSKDWDRIISPWNLRLRYTPAAVAIPQTIDQTQAAVLCGINHQLRISAKGGGHSSGSYGLGGENGHLVIDFEQMDQVTLHDNHTAIIEPGARLGHVSVELFDQGRRAIPHGTCPGVGIAGHVLHGGYGRASRTHGLTLDWLKSAKVILSDGSIVHCSATDNMDLFWAIRGAGSSFGIVTEFEFDTFESPESVTVFTINLPWSEKSVIESLKAVQDLSLMARKDLNLAFAVTASSQAIRGLYFGDEHELVQALQPLLVHLKTKLSDVKSVNWLDGLRYFADGEPLVRPQPYNMHTTTYTSSLTTPPLTNEQIGVLVSTLFTNINDTNARHSWDILFELYGGPKSAVSQTDIAATSYVHRDKFLLWQLNDFGENGELPRESFAVLKQIMDSVTQSMGDGYWGMYANSIDTQLDSNTAQKLYWGDNLPRLRKIKARLDPGNVFWNPQGISPST